MGVKCSRDFWVGLEELCDLGGLMSRQIVEDDMYPRREHLNRTPLVTRVQTCQTLLQESAFPLADIRRPCSLPSAAPAYSSHHLPARATPERSARHPRRPRRLETRLPSSLCSS